MAVTMNNYLNVLKLAPDSRLDSCRRSAFSWMINSYPEAIGLNGVDLREHASYFGSVNIAIDSSEISDASKFVHESSAGEVSRVND